MLAMFTPALLVAQGNRVTPKNASGAAKNVTDAGLPQVLRSPEQEQKPLVEVRGINSEARDNAPLISANGRVMFFNSTRQGNRSWAHYSAARGRYDDDIYYSVRLPSNADEEVWSEPVNLGPAINTSEDDGVAAISPDGRTIYFVSLKPGWERDNGPFYRADLQGTEWSNIRGLGGGITKFLTTTRDKQKLRVYGASISPDGRDFYFATTAHSNGDHHQIWVSHSVDGVWSYPENLGPTINLPAGSYAPFIAADGKTLYFTTRAENGFGGDDVHYTMLRNGKWEPPVNIGAPINSAGDDAFLSIPASGDRVYISTSRNGNDDIYMTELPKAAQPEKVVLLTGTVKSKGSGAPVAAMVSIEDQETGLKVFETRTDSATGSYTAVVPAGKNYGIAVTAPGFGFSVNRYKAAGDKRYAEVDQSFDLEQLEKGKSFVLNNIFFEYGASTLTPSSKGELNTLIDLLKHRTTMTISVDGYTDSLGSPTFNKALSQQRASAVRRYLISVGRVSPKRIEVRGFGADRPIATNTTDEGRSKNRRVEFSITSLQ